MDQLLTESAQFLLDNYPITLVNHQSYFGNDGNFKKIVKLTKSGRFMISLKRDFYEA